jgi:hypothetical protein
MGHQHRRSGSCIEELLALQRIEPRFLGPPARMLDTVATELPHNVDAESEGKLAPWRPQSAGHAPLRARM